MIKPEPKRPNEGEFRAHVPVVKGPKTN